MIAAPPLSQRETFGRTLVELAEEDPRILVLDGDLASSTRADIFAEAYPDRFLQMGIAEQTMIGVAAGLATLGRVPFVSTFACFAVCRALDAIRVLVAQPSLNVKITGGYSGLLTGMTGKTHQVVDDIAIMRAMPHMTVLVPGDELETRQALRAAAQMSGPVYLRLTRDPSPAISGPDYRFEIGRNVLLRTGADVGLISTGVQTSRVLAAADLLAAEGIEAAVLHVPTIKPLDQESIVELARRVPRIVTSEDHTVLGGLGGAVTEVLARRHPTLVLRHGLEDTFGESAPNEALLDKYGLSAAHVAHAVRRFLRS
ncbi:MAG TPA: transketolase C-terminal domain-containing protein [Candidatus Saccharimonadales bacterium]|nr:transketolase C-terminal domain-containing protein [Candidatus Saccharimonadales bacterium]